MVTLAVERHRVEDPGERQHVASADCWCEPVVEVVHRRPGWSVETQHRRQEAPRLVSVPPTPAEQEAWIDQARKDGAL